MSKTLEKIAADAAAEWIKGSTTNHSLANACALCGYNAGFLAGYKTAQEHTHAALEEAEARIQELRDRLMKESGGRLKLFKDDADAKAALLEALQEAEGQMEEIKYQVVDAGKVINSLNNSNGWISVKDRLPEEDIAVLVYGQVLNDPPDVIGVRRRYNGDQEWKYTWESEDGFIYREDDVTHWMPLPEPPKEEK